jgi:hypothetical protein
MRQNGPCQWSFWWCTKPHVFLHISYYLCCFRVSFFEMRDQYGPSNWNHSLDQSWGLFGGFTLYSFWCFLFFLTYFMYISTKYSCRNQILPFEAPSIVSCWEHFRCLIFFPICSSRFGCFRSVLKVVWCLIRILEFHNCYIIFILCNIFPSRSNPKIISGNCNLILSISLLCFLLYFWLLNWKKIFPVTKSLIYL